MSLLGRWSLLVAIAASSSPSCTLRCDERAVAGLIVVIDPGTGSVCDPSLSVTATAIDGNHEESLQSGPDPCVFTGLIERPGAYLVRVEGAAGPAASVPLVIPTGDCHVETQTVHVQL